MREMPPFKEAEQPSAVQRGYRRGADSQRVVSHSNGVKKGVLPMLCAGLTYGFTSCAPLLLMIGYSFTLPVAMAGAMAIAFSLASMASPVLLLTVITGALSQKMRQEIPGCIKWFRLESYLLLMVMPFVVS